LQRVRLRGADDGVALVAFVGVDPDQSADGHHALLARLLLDHGGVADHPLEGLDPALHEALLVLGLRVLGVLGDVPAIPPGAAGPRRRGSGDRSGPHGARWLPSRPWRATRWWASRKDTPSEASCSALSVA